MDLIGLPGDVEDSTNGNIEIGSPENGRINKWYYRGRPEEKSFLYEIVANKISGKNKFQEKKLFIEMDYTYLKFIFGLFESFDIVWNCFNLGVDVDKWDYFLRDKEYLKVIFEKKTNTSANE